MFKFISAIAFAGLMTSSLAFGLPLPKPGMSPMSLPKTFTANGYDFEGIVALSNCSGSLIRFENSKDTDKAVVLTNGHCYEGGFFDPGTFVTHTQSNRRFNLYDANMRTVGSLHATEVEYGSMTKTDITIYKLDETYAQIMSQYHVRPFTLSSQHPVAGTPIQVVSGYWERGYSCQIETFVNELHEGGWAWQDSVRYSRPGCEVIGGTSGSPVIATGTRNVIAINNTGNEDGERCTVNNPCEVDKSGGISYHQGYSYAEETYWIYTCLNSQNEIDVNQTGCALFH